MRRFRAKTCKIPESIRIFQVRFGVALLRVNERWKEVRVANKENWRIIAHQVPHAIIRVQFNWREQLSILVQILVYPPPVTHQQNPEGLSPYLHFQIHLPQ